MNSDRWTIDELCARYSLEDTINDVFVEGAFDCDILRETQLPKHGYTFYEIDNVDIPLNVLAQYQLTCGNKQRLVALSHQLNENNIGVGPQCLVDRDLDHWLGVLLELPHLRWTKCCDIETFFLSKDNVVKILITFGKAKIAKLDLFFNSLCDLLRRLYCLRLTAQEMHLMIDWIDFSKYLSKTTHGINFDLNKYIISVLGKNKFGKKTAEFKTAFEKRINQLGDEIQLCARGHDFVQALAWVVTKFGGLKEVAQQEVIQRLLVVFARDAEGLGAELFQH